MNRFGPIKARFSAEDLEMLERQQQNLLRHPERSLLRLNIDSGGVLSRRKIENADQRTGSFGMSDQTRALPPTRTPCPADGSFMVKLKRSQAVYEIPAGKTVLAVLEENGVDVPFSCTEGICGTCVTGVIAGTPEHHDMFLTKQEQDANDQFTPCCSRSKTALLILDL
ncbi:MAG: 2Fe-2S iron-sulfur cluster-binding protein [Thiolinea sp.]